MSNVWPWFDTVSLLLYFLLFSLSFFSYSFRSLVVLRKDTGGFFKKNSVHGLTLERYAFLAVGKRRARKEDQILYTLK